jgi:Protein of unknown function (DUF3562)
MAEQSRAKVATQNDEAIVRATSERLAKALHRPEEDVEPAVRDELTKWRSTARVQTFVPIFAERSARRRLAG